MITNNGKPFLFYVGFALFGYALAAPISEIFPIGIGDLRVTIQYRILVLVAAIALIFKTTVISQKTYLDRPGKLGFLLLLGFWFIYTCRLFYDASFQADALGENTVNDYLLSGYVFGFITLMSLTRPYSQEDISYVFQISFYILLLGVSLSLYLVIFAILSGEWEGTSRFSLERLNPISVGLYSGTLFILSFGLRAVQPKQTLLLPIGILIGFLGVFLSGSRGALVSLFMVLMVILWSRFSLKNLLGLMTLFVIISLVAIWLISFLMADVDIVSNYLATGSDRDQSAQIRFRLYEAALTQFYSNPIFGDLIVVRDMKFYPHNQFLEILMATGIIGASLYLMLNSVIYFKLKRLLKGLKDAQTMARILSYLLVFNLTAGLFSGAIILSSEYWFLCTITLFASFNKVYYVK